MRHKHCWFVEQQTKHTWCHLCGQHKTPRMSEDDQFLASRRGIIEHQRRVTLAGPRTLTERGVR